MSGPIVITERDQIRGVADRWKKQYRHNDGHWTEIIGGSSGAVYERLAALDLETATPADVAAVIGNDSWTKLECDACERFAMAVVRVGQEQDYESRTADLCLSCVTAAVDALRPSVSSRGAR